jgi:hypothetical protein
MDPFLTGPLDLHARDHVRRPPVQCAIALKNIEIMKRERIVERVAEHEADSARRSSSCSTCRSSATCAGRLLLRARARQGQGDARDVLDEESERCCAASSRASCSSAG